MSNAKEAILKRIRNALDTVPKSERPEDVSVPRDYRREGELRAEEIVALFASRTSEYKATVRRISQDRLKDAVAQACSVQQVKRLVVPAGLPKEWLPDTITPLYDQMEIPLTHSELDGSDGVITSCALAVAQTGTIILDGGSGQGRRALTLLPDYHLCIVREEQIVELIPEAFTRVEQAVSDQGRPITFISGPSATSDIELSRVEGVHGPRRLEVLVVAE